MTKPASADGHPAPSPSAAEPATPRARRWARTSARRRVRSMEDKRADAGLGLMIAITISLLCWAGLYRLLF